eukprot:COSAG06_NODE_7480_length_2490_cov_22.873693_2_plen_87_part_00
MNDAIRQLGAALAMPLPHSNPRDPPALPSAHAQPPAPPGPEEREGTSTHPNPLPHTDQHRISRDADARAGCDTQHHVAVAARSPAE